jgi:hypothetical protein
MGTRFLAALPLLLCACGQATGGAARVVLLVPGSECGAKCNFDFGIVEKTPAAHAFQLVNVGDATADLQASLVGDEFALNAGAAQLAAGALTELTVTATPTKVAPSTGALTMSWSSVGEHAHQTSEVKLAASVPAAGLVFEGSCGFGDVPTGVTSAPCNITLRNQSADEIEIDSVTIVPAVFTPVSSLALPELLGPDQTITLSFTVTPLATGPVAGQLSIQIGGLINTTTLSANGT